MARVRFKKVTTAAYQNVTNPDGNTLYFVSDTGDFSPSSLDVEGELYLGNKLISANRKKPIYYGVCTTKGNVSAKNITIDSNVLPLVTGGAMFVSFQYSNTVSSPVIRINGDSVTDTPVKRYGTTNPGTSSYTSWNAGSTVCLVYDGQYWQMVGWINTSYSDFVANTETEAGTHGLVPAPSAMSGENTVLTAKGWKQSLLVNTGMHCGGTSNNTVWARVVEAIGQYAIEATTDCTAVILVTKHTSNVSDRYSGRVGMLAVDFRSNLSEYIVRARWIFKTETMGTPVIKVGVEIVDSHYVVRLYIQNTSWTSYGFSVITSLSWNDEGVYWRCYRGRTGWSAISTYASLPSSPDEDIVDIGSEIVLNAKVTDSEQLDGHPASYYALKSELPQVFGGADDGTAGTAGLVPAPGMSAVCRYLTSEKNNAWQRPDTTPTQNSGKLITSGAVYAAIGDIETLLASI